MSSGNPRVFSDIAEHSVCHPGLPMPHGDSQPGCTPVLGFHKTKSAGSFLKSATSTLLPAICSSLILFDNLP